MSLYNDLLNEIKDAIARNISLEDITNFHYSLSALLNIFNENPEGCEYYIKQIEAKLRYYRDKGENAFSEGVSNFINYTDPKTNLEVRFVNALPKRYTRYLYHSINSNQGFFLTELSSSIMLTISDIIRNKNNKDNAYIDVLDNYDGIIDLCNLLEFGQVYGLLCKKNYYSLIKHDLQDIYDEKDYIPIGLIIHYAKVVREGF